MSHGLASNIDAVEQSLDIYEADTDDNLTEDEVDPEVVNTIAEVLFYDEDGFPYFLRYFFEHDFDNENIATLVDLENIDAEGVTFTEEEEPEASSVYLWYININKRED